MKASEIREMSVDEIEAELDDAREEYMRLRFQRATGELTDFNVLRSSRHKIARLLTILNEYDLEDEAEEEAEAEGEE